MNDEVTMNGEEWKGLPVLIPGVNDVIIRWLWRFSECSGRKVSMTCAIGPVLESF